MFRPFVKLDGLLGGPRKRWGGVTGVNARGKGAQTYEDPTQKQVRLVSVEAERPNHPSRRGVVVVVGALGLYAD